MVGGSDEASSDDAINTAGDIISKCLKRILCD